MSEWGVKKNSGRGGDLQWMMSWKQKISLCVANPKIKLLVFYFQVTNSKSKNKKFNFESLTRRLNFFFFYFRFTNSKLKNKKVHFELLTWNQKWKKLHRVTNSSLFVSLSSNWLEAKKQKVTLWVNSSKLKNI